MHFLSSFAFVYLILFAHTKILYAFRQPKNRVSINMKTHCIENNWSNVDKNTIFIDEKKFEEKDITRFTEIFEQSEKALELVEKKLEMVDLGIKHEKKKIEDWSINYYQKGDWFSSFVERIL